MHRYGAVKTHSAIVLVTLYLNINQIPRSKLKGHQAYCKAEPGGESTLTAFANISKRTKSPLQAQLLGSLLAGIKLHNSALIHP